MSITMAQIKRYKKAEDYLKENKKLAKKENKDFITKRYYFWEWCRSYGWRQMGNNYGYRTLKELYNDCSYMIGYDWNKRKTKYTFGSPSDNWKILVTSLKISKKL